ncbi:hypothetical protein [Yinghuangia seranimata]|uniref:hypothetical protein n=1 Tax=Yinghuangia seranimata TaxID=408067 RepID=UPI00248D2505|nr:hypothetical protein [Yinghuangia seranimata]MDI2132008.1 hypothetical protein [Yinghuangia seranimata]
MGVSVFDEAKHHLILGLDVAGSGRLSDRAKLRMRGIVYDVLDEAFDAARVLRDETTVEDRGDGVLAAIGAGVPEERMAGVWLDAVYRAVREHNEPLRDPVRLRVAMHAGQVRRDGYGLVGTAVDLACRLVDCDTAKAVLAAAPDAPLVMVASSSLYDGVVRQGGPGVEPQAYAKLPVRAKEVDTFAWFRVPGMSQPPVPTGSTGSTEPPGPRKRSEDGGPDDQASRTDAPRGARAESRDDGTDPRSAGAPQEETPPAASRRKDAPTAARNVFNVVGTNMVFDRSTIHGGVFGTHPGSAPTGAAAPDEELGGGDE